MPISTSARLIVNADDFGLDTEATDQTIRAFRAGRLTSATLMVHMADSERGAALATEAGLPVGLHVNLTDPFTSAQTPAAVRSRQLRACAHFSPSQLRLRSWLFDPRIRHDVEASVADQLQRFEELFGHPPPHLDGHNHVHVCPNVALAAPLRAVQRRRDALWAWPGTRSPMGAARAIRRALAYRDFLTTRFFFDVHELYQSPPGELERQIGAARSTSVEVMAHPGFPHELEALMSQRWEELLDGAPTGSYRDLDWPAR